MVLGTLCQLPWLEPLLLGPSSTVINMHCVSRHTPARTCTVTPGMHPNAHTLSGLHSITLLRMRRTHHVDAAAAKYQPNAQALLYSSGSMQSHGHGTGNSSTCPLKEQGLCTLSLLLSATAAGANMRHARSRSFIPPSESAAHFRAGASSDDSAVAQSKCGAAASSTGYQASHTSDGCLGALKCCNMIGSSSSTTSRLCKPRFWTSTGCYREANSPKQGSLRPAT